MHCIEPWLNTHSRIFSFHVYQNRYLSFCTHYHGAYVYDLKNTKFLYHLTHPSLDCDISSYAFNNSLQLFVFCKGKTLFVTKDLHKAKYEAYSLPYNLSSIYFDTDTSFLAINDQEELIRYDLQMGEKLSTLYKMQRSKEKLFALQDSILALAFNNTLVFIDFLARTTIKTISNSLHLITALVFIDSNTLAYACSDGTIFIEDIFYDKRIKIDTPLLSVKQILSIPQSDYLLLHTQEESIALIDIQSKKLLQIHYIKLSSSIETLTLIYPKLFIALRDTKVVIVDLLDTHELQSMILHNTLAEAYTLISANPLLKSSSYYLKLEESFQKRYKEIINSFESLRPEILKEFCKLYETSTIKREELWLLKKAFENYENFCTFIAQKNYLLAYALATKYSPLQQRKEYKTLEYKWYQSLQKAQLSLRQNKLDDAQELLSPFRTIHAKKDLIALLLRDNPLVLSFLSSIEHKEFATAYKLAKQKHSLQRLPHYKQLLSSIRKELVAIQDIQNKEQLVIISEKIKNLEGIDFIYKDLEQLKETLQLFKNFWNCYEADQFIKCYTLLDNHALLHTTQTAVLLNKYWKTLNLKAESYALDADLEAIKKVFGPLLYLKTRANKTGEILRTCYLYKIAQLIKERFFYRSEILIYRYIDTFGEDEALISLMKLFEINTKRKLALNIQTKRNNLDSWIEKELFF